MTRRTELFRRSISATAALLMLATSIAVPLMERGALVAETGVESRHDPERCAHGHDHRVCTQVTANLSLAAPESGDHTAHAAVRTAPPTEAPAIPGRSAQDGPPSRAPPSA